MSGSAKLKDSLIKSVVKTIYFRPGAVRQIRLGPLRGMKYQVSHTTGLSAWYSGPERDHQRVFKTILKAGDTVIDVGANWGLHSLYLSKLVGTDGTVIAIEAFPEVLELLKWHLDRNQCANVRVIEEAASDSDGEALFAAAASAYLGSLAEVTPLESADRRHLKVRTTTLDSVVKRTGATQVRLIKIDVEGAESKVLRGGEGIIQQFRPYLVVDLHTPEQDVNVGNLLSAWGYKLSRLSGPPILRTDLGWPHENGVWGTILASPE